MCLFALLTGCRGLENGNMTWVQPESDQPHAGNVYLVRGLIGVFSTGMDDLSVKLNQNGVRARVYQDAQHSVLADQIVAGYKGAKNPEPLVLIGHSYGADDVVTIANVLDKQGIKVDLLVTIDATVPPKVPANVAVCYNYFQSNATDVIPMFRGIPLEHQPGANGKLYNIDVRKNGKELLEPGTNHINIDKNPLVHAVVIKEVLDVCPPRPAWVAVHRTTGSPSAQAQQASQTIAPSNQRVASQVGRAN
ncbi:MAG TPA: hypothetical protein VHD56_07345 [Tepidisphaeraceae bacterium]|nr:hypothetical protein [Tepidisphaeraceae bacterium]